MDRNTSDELRTSPLTLLRSRGGEHSHLPLDFRAAALRAFDLACVQLRHVEKFSELFFTGLAAEDVLRHRNLHRQPCSTEPILPPPHGEPSPARTASRKRPCRGTRSSLSDFDFDLVPPKPDGILGYIFGCGRTEHAATGHIKDRTASRSCEQQATRRKFAHSSPVCGSQARVLGTVFALRVPTCWSVMCNQRDGAKPVCNE